LHGRYGLGQEPQFRHRSMQSAPSRGAFADETEEPSFQRPDRELLFDCIYDYCILDKKAPNLLASAGLFGFEGERAPTEKL
jgi:hypothetical protein